MPAKIEMQLPIGESSMHWDVVEVKAESGHRLFVRFADGTSGKVQLELSDLSGVLAPLQDPSFFERVFVDHGAVAWPGDIDLAPDAMYEQVITQGSPAEPANARWAPKA